MDRRRKIIKDTLRSIITEISNRLGILIRKQSKVKSSCQAMGAFSKKQGIDKLYIILSFDCDTPLDAMASEHIAGIFSQRDIPAVFAVPGRILEQNTSSYKLIAGMGFDFLNHGYLDHAAYDNSQERYYSITWYHEMTEEDVRNDIRKAHDTITNLLDCIPKGFRAPHFGYYQNPSQLEIIYSESAGLKYDYATTTMPAMGLKNGPVYQVSHGIYEFPVSGTYDNPLVILDSWQFLAAPDRIYTEKDYTFQFQKLVGYYTENNLPCILNLYADPSHIVESKAYFDCLEFALHKGAQFSTYSRILESIKRR